MHIRCLFVLSFFPRDVSDEILNLIESVSEGFPSYSRIALCDFNKLPGYFVIIIKDEYPPFVVYFCLF